MVMKPYEIWILETGEEEYPLVSFTAPIGLTDEQAKTEAELLLNKIIGKIQDPTPDTLEVRAGLITPNTYHIRLFRRWNEIRNF